MHVAVDKTHRPTIEDEAQSIARIEARLSAEGERRRSRSGGRAVVEPVDEPSTPAHVRREANGRAGSALLRERTGLRRETTTSPP